MSTLRDVSLELARMEREMKKKEEEYNKQVKKSKNMTELKKQNLWFRVFQM